MKNIFALLILTFSFLNLYSADEGKTIMIAGFINKGKASENNANLIMTKSFIAFFDKIPGSKLIPYDSVEKAAKGGFWTKKALDTDMAVRLAQQLNADLVVTGDYIVDEDKNTIVINFVVINVITKDIRLKTTKTGVAGIDMFDSIDEMIQDTTGLILGKKIVLATLTIQIKNSSRKYQLYLSGKNIADVDKSKIYKTQILADEPQELSLRLKDSGTEVYREVVSPKKNETKSINYTPSSPLSVHIVNLEEEAYVYIDKIKIKKIENEKTLELPGILADTDHLLQIKNNGGIIIENKTFRIEEGKSLALDFDAKVGKRFVFFPVRAIDDGPGGKAGIDFYITQSFRLGINASVLYVTKTLIYGFEGDITYYIIPNDGKSFGLGISIDSSVYMIDGFQTSAVGKIYLEYGQVFLDAGVRYSVTQNSYHPVCGLGYRF
jgi:hypothetical protein